MFDTIYLRTLYNTGYSKMYIITILRKTYLGSSWRWYQTSFEIFQSRNNVIVLITLITNF